MGPERHSPFRTLVVALMIPSLAAACGGDEDSGQRTLREIASSIECTQLKATPMPSGSKEVLRAGTCVRDGDGVIITTYTSNRARDEMVRRMDDDVTALIDRGDRWTAFASPELDDVDPEGDAGGDPGRQGSTCDAAREAFLNGTDDEIEAALDALLADATAPAAARKYADAYLYGDAANPDQRDADKELILSACGG